MMSEVSMLLAMLTASNALTNPAPPPVLVVETEGFVFAAYGKIGWLVPEPARPCVTGTCLSSMAIAQNIAMVNGCGESRFCSTTEVHPTAASVNDNCPVNPELDPDDPLVSRPPACVINSASTTINCDPYEGSIEVKTCGAMETWTTRDANTNEILCTQFKTGDPAASGSVALCYEFSTECSFPVQLVVWGVLATSMAVEHDNGIACGDFTPFNGTSETLCSVIDSIAAPPAPIDPLPLVRVQVTGPNNASSSHTFDETDETTVTITGPGTWCLTFTTEAAPLGPAGGDANGDDIVCTADRILILQSLGATSTDPNYIASVDLDGDGTIEAAEVQGVVSYYDAQCVFGDFNCDGFLDFFDYNDFVAAYELGDPSADVNGDGFVDFFDYNEYAALYEC